MADALIQPANRYILQYDIHSITPCRVEWPYERGGASYCLIKVSTSTLCAESAKLYLLLHPAAGSRLLKMHCKVGEYHNTTYFLPHRGGVTRFTAIQAASLAMPAPSQSHSSHVITNG